MQELALSAVVCHAAIMGEEGRDQIDRGLLDCFLELSLKARIETAANFANAIERLRCIRPAEDTEGGS